MGVLNLRDVPDELMRELRAQAALEGSQFHPFCKELLKWAVEARRSRISTPARTLADTINLSGRHYYEPLEGHTAPTYGGIARSASPAPEMQSTASPDDTEASQEIEIT